MYKNSREDHEKFGHKERRDAAENRKLILQKAGTLFDKYGIDAVSMHQIAKSAGVGQGTLYRRYAHKGELCIDLMHENFQSFIDGLDSELTKLRKEPPRMKLVAFLQHMGDYMDNQSAWLETIQLQGSVRKKKQDPMRQSSIYMIIHDRLRSLLEEIPQSAENSPRLFDPALAADVILASFAPDFYLFLRRDRGLSKKEIVEGLIGLYLEPLFI